MSAEPIHPAAASGGARTAPWQPDPVRQQLADYSIEDVLALPADAPRVELLDGVLTVVPSPTLDHQDISSLLCAWLRRHAPDGYRATQAVGVAVGPRNTYEPDVLLHRAEGSRDRHYLTPDEVLLVVEVVSPATRRRDRFHRPAGYAAVGIGHYWRVEQDPVRIYVYQLGDRPGASGEREYALVAESADLLELDAPFPVKLPISEITP
ncbi:MULTISPECIES: Uma2 family endonuclease [unclassified Solwaraspora]|uniref:Uma2 family endonuclease n=1 Tax=unclassified Solwaraspora TaxID=2627926 RepID=UPI00248B9D6B|nr:MULTISPECIES: Uma2 family endonuclease [unclassified Solwaraspora]WBB94826.1 Uma2 family endonuclease [Solwaraspora sp. WMMA2059]WBC21288.1 Uma2 family endonuclease [Solwaraspora sp. WMMA2080]WJK36631.1 Uma2 family endonuclease [Solwaraspora sp. WMMA2065]